MNYELKGKLVAIFDEQQISDRFKKREFVVEAHDGMYPQFIKFQLTQDKCDLISGFNTNEEVNVRFNLRGRPYEKQGTTIYFTNLEAWKITAENVESGSSAPSAPKSDDSINQGMQEPPFTQADDDALPF